MVSCPVWMIQANRPLSPFRGMMRIDLKAEPAIYKVIPKSGMPSMLEKWAETSDVFAPVLRNGASAFQRMVEPPPMEGRTFTNTRYPPKSLFFPQSEVLLEMTKEGLCGIEYRQKPAVAVGIRPCDARALTLLDNVFMDGACIDPYWQVGRKRTTVVSLACSAPRDTCFCTGVGSDPFDEIGSDALLIEEEKHFIVKIISDKGRTLFAGQKTAPFPLIESIEAARRTAISGMPVISALRGNRVRDRLYAVYGSDFWDEIQQTCIGCGVCTFLCPTCHCFDIVDEPARGERVRNWDTCMFRLYSQEASGNNPRPSNIERTRNRIMHKFAYFPDRHDETACTGCGRCIRNCPVNIDIRQVMRQAMEV